MPAHAPPSNLTDPGFAGPGELPGMRSFCITRHGRAINIVFLDGHGERVALDDLWKLQWQNDWVVRGVTLPAE